MKNTTTIFCFIFAIIVILQWPLRSDAGPFGAGILLGSPSAISAKYWIDQRRAIDGGLAIGLNDYALFFGDYLIHYPGAFGNRDRFVAQLTPYLGVGAALAITSKDRSADSNYLGKSSGSAGIAIRVPLGIEWRASDPPLGVFVEIAPGLSLIPRTDIIVNGGIGIRYYF